MSKMYYHVEIGSEMRKKLSCVEITRIILRNAGSLVALNAQRNENIRIDRLHVFVIYAVLAYLSLCVMNLHLQHMR